MFQLPTAISPGAADPGRQGRQLPTQFFRIYLVNLAQKFCLKFFINCLPTQYKNGSAAPGNWHAMRGGLMLPDSVSEEKIEID